MELANRIKSFEFLGKRLREYHETTENENLVSLVKAAQTATSENPWFTHELIRIALNNLGKALNTENLNRWLSMYEGKMDHFPVQKMIGVVMAGNLPAVGFHDFLCVLISGHKLVAKLSASDGQLLPAMANLLAGYMPEWSECISFTKGKLENFDAIIATGSNNTSRYFEFYFGRYPHIIRKNRNSVAVLTGNESNEDLNDFADDIMLFFGMGCRSISKVYVPTGYNFTALIRALGRYGHYADHHKYRNNYDYCKSIFQVSQVPFIDTGFLLLHENQTIASRIAVLNYEYYQNPDEVADSIKNNNGSIQCVISKMPLTVSSLKPGNGQKPALWEYADQIDTMEFLLSLI
jgi:hypothetical protein